MNPGSMLGESATTWIRCDPKLLVDPDSNSLDPKMLEPYGCPVPDRLETVESFRAEDLRAAAASGFPLGWDLIRIIRRSPDRSRPSDGLSDCLLEAAVVASTVSEARTSFLAASALPFCLRRQPDESETDLSASSDVSSSGKNCSGSADPFWENPVPSVGRVSSEVCSSRGLVLMAR